MMAYKCGMSTTTTTTSSSPVDSVHLPPIYSDRQQSHQPQDRPHGMRPLNRSVTRAQVRELYGDRGEGNCDRSQPPVRSPYMQASSSSVAISPSESSSAGLFLQPRFPQRVYSVHHVLNSLRHGQAPTAYVRHALTNPSDFHLFVSRLLRSGDEHINMLGLDFLHLIKSLGELQFVNVPPSGGHLAAHRGCGEGSGSAHPSSSSSATLIGTSDESKDKNIGPRKTPTLLQQQHQQQKKGHIRGPLPPPPPPPLMSYSRPAPNVLLPQHHQYVPPILSHIPLPTVTVDRPIRIGRQSPLSMASVSSVSPLAMTSGGLASTNFPGCHLPTNPSFLSRSLGFPGQLRAASPEMEYYSPDMYGRSSGYRTRCVLCLQAERERAQETSRSRSRDDVLPERTQMAADRERDSLKSASSSCPSSPIQMRTTSIAQAKPSPSSTPIESTSAAATADILPNHPRTPRASTTRDSSSSTESASCPLSFQMMYKSQIPLKVPRQSYYGPPGPAHRAHLKAPSVETIIEPPSPTGSQTSMILAGHEATEETTHRDHNHAGPDERDRHSEEEVSHPTPSPVATEVEVTQQIIASAAAELPMESVHVQENSSVNTVRDQNRRNDLNQKAGDPSCDGPSQRSPDRNLTTEDDQESALASVETVIEVMGITPPAVTSEIKTTEERKRSGSDKTGKETPLSIPDSGVQRGDEDLIVGEKEFKDGSDEEGDRTLENIVNSTDSGEATRRPRSARPGHQRTAASGHGETSRPPLQEDRTLPSTSHDLKQPIDDIRQQQKRPESQCTICTQEEEEERQEETAIQPDGHPLSGTVHQMRIGSASAPVSRRPSVDDEDLFAEEDRAAAELDSHALGRDMSLPEYRGHHGSETTIQEVTVPKMTPARSLVHCPLSYLSNSSTTTSEELNCLMSSSSEGHIRGMVPLLPPPPPPPPTRFIRRAPDMGPMRMPYQQQRGRAGAAGIVGPARGRGRGGVRGRGGGRGRGAGRGGRDGTLTRRISRSHSPTKRTAVGAAAAPTIRMPPAIPANADLRHILENVAETEGPFKDPHEAMRAALCALVSDSWSQKIEGMLAVTRLASFHPSVLQRHLHQVVECLVVEARSLRSTVARSAIFTLGDLFRKMRKPIESELDTIAQCLLVKAGENVSFMREDLERALAALVREMPQSRAAIALITYGANHRSAITRRTTAQFLAHLVEVMGSTRTMFGPRDISAHLMPAAARFVMEGNPYTRYYGRRIFNVLIQHSSFERVLRKHVSPATYRNIVGVLESIKRRGVGDMPKDTRRDSDEAAAAKRNMEFP